MDEALKEVAARFDAYIHAGIPRLKKLGYNPSYFLEMIRNTGSAVQATSQLLASPRHTSYGFQRLYELNRLEDSVEFATLLPWFEPLFTPEERELARTRLVLHDFPVDAKLRAATAAPPDWVG